MTMPSIEARITKVEQDAGTGWYRISTDDERVKRLDTKIEEKAQEAARLMNEGSLVLIDFTERQGNPNPHQPGSYYMNRYYEQAGSLAEKKEEIPVVTPTGRRTDPEDAWRIALSVGAKLAVETMPLMPAEQRTFEAQKRIAHAWAEWLTSTPSPSQEADDIPY
jgi:hypothetical protein